MPHKGISFRLHPFGVCSGLIRACVFVLGLGVSTVKIEERGSSMEPAGTMGTC